MLRCSKFLTLLLLECRTASRRPSPVPELSVGFDLLYEQKFAEARQIFANWEYRNREDPFGEVAVAASYLFEELYLQGLLTSDFFLNEKKFLGIDGRPNPERMSHFGEALTRARELAKARQKTNPTLSAPTNNPFQQLHKFLPVLCNRIFLPVTVLNRRQFHSHPLRRDPRSAPGDGPRRKLPHTWL